MVIKKKCWRCGGKGWKVNKGLAILSFGFSAIIQYAMGKDDLDECQICHGKGYIKGGY